MFDEKHRSNPPVFASNKERGSKEIQRKVKSPKQYYAREMNECNCEGYLLEGTLHEDNFKTIDILQSLFINHNI